MYGTSSSTAALQPITNGLSSGGSRLSPVDEKYPSFQQQPSTRGVSRQAEANGGGKDESTARNADENMNPRRDSSMDSPKKSSAIPGGSFEKSGLSIPKTNTQLRFRDNNAVNNDDSEKRPKRRVISDSHWRKDNKSNQVSRNSGANKTPSIRTTTTTETSSTTPDKPQRRKTDLLDQYVENSPQPRITSRSTPFGISNIYQASSYTTNDSFIKPPTAFAGSKLLTKRSTSPQVSDGSAFSKNKFGKATRSDYTTTASHTGLPTRHTLTHSIDVPSSSSRDVSSSRSATSARVDQRRTQDVIPEIPERPAQPSDRLSHSSKYPSSLPLATKTNAKEEGASNEVSKRHDLYETPSSSPPATPSVIQERIPKAISERLSPSQSRPPTSPTSRNPPSSPPVTSRSAYEQRHPSETSERHASAKSSNEVSANSPRGPSFTKPKYKATAEIEEKSTSRGPRSSIPRVTPTSASSAKPPSSSSIESPVSKPTTKTASIAEKWEANRAWKEDILAQPVDEATTPTWSPLSSPTAASTTDEERTARRTPRDSSARSSDTASITTNRSTASSTTIPDPTGEEHRRSRAPRRNTIQNQTQENNEAREGRDVDRRRREQRSLSRFPVRRKPRTEPIEEPRPLADASDGEKPPPLPVHRVLPGSDSGRLSSQPQSPSGTQTRPLPQPPSQPTPTPKDASGDDRDQYPRAEGRGRQVGERNRRARSPSRAPVHRDKPAETMETEIHAKPREPEIPRSTRPLPIPPVFSKRSDAEGISKTRQPPASSEPTPSPDTIDGYLEEKIKQRVAEQIQMRAQTPSPAPPSPEVVPESTPEAVSENSDIPATSSFDTPAASNITPTAATPVPGSSRLIKSEEKASEPENKNHDIPPHDTPPPPEEASPVKLSQRTDIPGADRRESTVLSPDSGSKLTNVDDLLSLISSTLSLDSKETRSPKSAPVYNAISPVPEDTGTMSPVSVPERLSPAKATRGLENQGLKIRVKDVMRQHERHEARYIRELRTLISGVIPVLLNSVLNNKTDAAGLFGPTATPYEAENFSRPLVSMAMSLRSLKELHNEIPIEDADALLEWIDTAQHAYLEYLSSWRLGFQNVVVNLAPPNPEDDANAETQSLYAGMSQDSDGDVVDEDGIKVDVAYLLKRPLVRLKFFVKTLKGLNTVQPSQKARQMTMVYQELVSLARQRSTEERARIEDEAAWSIDTKSARSLRTLAALDNVSIDRTRTVRARDPFDLSLVHSNGEEISCECEIVLRDNPSQQKAGGDLLICEVDKNGRWLLFAPIERDRASARLGEGDGEVVLMVRGFPGERDWHELLLLRTEDDEIAEDWVSMLGSKPLPGAINRGSADPARRKGPDDSVEHEKSADTPAEREEKQGPPNKRSLIGYQLPKANSPSAEADTVISRPQTPANQIAPSSGLKRSPAKRMSRAPDAPPEHSASPEKPAQPEQPPAATPPERTGSPEKRRSRFSEFLHRSISPEKKTRSPRKSKE